MASHERDNLVVFSSRVASHERDNLVVFYYITVGSDIWPDKRGGFSLERDNLVVFYYITVHLTSGRSDKRGGFS